MRPLAHPGQTNNILTASERGQKFDASAGGASRKPRTAPARHGDGNHEGARSPDMIAQSIPRNVDVPLSARTGGTAPGRHHSFPREQKTAEAPAVGSPCSATFVHRPNFSAPAVSRMRELPRAVSTPPEVRLPGRKQCHTGVTNARSVRGVEGSPVRPCTAARRDSDDTYEEGSSAHGATKSKERRGIEGVHRCRRLATRRAWRVPGDEESGDGSGSHKYRQKGRPQRQTQHEQRRGQGQEKELRGYRVEPAAYEFEQQQAETVGLGVTAAPAAAADVNVRQQNQPPADTTTERVSEFQQDFERNERVAQNPKNRRVLSTTNTETRTGKSEALVHGRGHAGRSVPFDRSAAAVRVQRVFRGHRGRRCAGAEGRKRASQRASEREAKMERERPHAASNRLSGRLPRPKLPSTYGF